MQVLRVLTALTGAVLSLQLSTLPASAHTPPGPEDLPLGVPSGEAASGVWTLTDAQADDLTTLPGARLLLKLADYHGPPDGSVWQSGGPAWFWMNTRAGSSFYLSCTGGWSPNPDGPSVVSGLGVTTRVSRKQFMSAVRAGRERTVRLHYNKHLNNGVFEAAIDGQGQGPLRGCPPDAPATAPDRPDFVGPDVAGRVVWGEGGRRLRLSQDNYEDQPADPVMVIRALPGDWLVVSYDNWGEPIHRWYGTRAPSSFYLPVCRPDGDGSVAVTRDQFVRAVTGQPDLNILFLYDADKDVGSFSVTFGLCWEASTP